MRFRGRFGRRLLVAASVVLVAGGCAPVAPAPSTAATPGAPGQAARTPADQEIFTRLLADEVLVLPAQEGALSDSIGRLSSSRARVARAVFDTAFALALAPAVVGEGWRWPRDARVAFRRNPLIVPDPDNLAVRDLRGARLRAEEQVPADLGSQIRALLAIVGSRRYVLLPVQLHLGPTSAGGSVAGVSIVAIDTRRSTIVAVRSIVLADPQRGGAARADFANVGAVMSSLGSVAARSISSETR